MCLECGKEAPFIMIRVTPLEFVDFIVNIFYITEKEKIS